MKFRDIIIIAVVAVGVIWMIYDSSSRKSSISTKQTPTSQTPSIDNHHSGGQPIDSTIFNDLANKKAPDFVLPSYDGKEISLGSLKSKNVVLFFNEGLMCYPACWDQIIAFGRDKRFKSADMVVLNIVTDPKSDWEKAIDKMPELAQATVLLDTDRAVSKTYGVLNLSSSMHPGQFPGHSYVVVDKDGVIRYVFDDPQMGIRNEELVKEIEKLN